MTFKLKMMVFLLVVTLLGVFLRSDLPDWLHLQDQTCALSSDLQYVQLFLSANYSLSEVAFNWWTGLQSEACNFSFYEATINKLFEILPPGPDLGKPSSDRCRTCSLVGNSGHLQGSRYGPLIDSQDLVMRINKGQTKGYEPDVGSKTTHRFMYPESALDLDNSTHLVLFPFKIQDLEWLIQGFTTGSQDRVDFESCQPVFNRSHMQVKATIKANKDLVMVVNPDFMRYVHEVWLEKKGSYPSTGFMALHLALHMCDEVHVFGFGADSDGNWSHYWEKLRDKTFQTGTHPGTLEYLVLQQLADGNKVKLYKRW